jgi:hypothetical protein
MPKQPAGKTKSSGRPCGVPPSSLVLFAWGTLEMSAPSNCRAMGETTGVSELQAQHELKPP